MKNLNSNSELHNPKIEIFRERCEARALLWACGQLHLHVAVDVLQQWAVEQGLVKEIGQDAVQGLMVEAFAALRDDLPRAEKKKPPADDEYDGLSSTFAKLCREVDEKQRRKLPDPPDEELHRRLDPILEHYGARYDDLVAGGLKLISYAGKDMVLGIVDKQGRVRHKWDGELGAEGFKTVTDQIDALLAEK